MTRILFQYAAYLQIGLALFTGCAPTQPFFIAKDNTMAHYLDQALAIEYADVQVESLPEASQAFQPLGPANAETEYYDLTLEDCISMALQNSNILRVANGSNTQTGSVAALLLSTQPGQLPSVYDTALVSTLSSTQPLQVDNQGNRVPFRGAIRSNQVGGVEDALSEFDAQYSSLIGYNTTDRPRNVGPGNPFNPQFFQALDANYQSALSKKLATGGVATLRATTVYSSNNVGIGVGRSVPSDYTQAIEMQISHPLLRGRGTLVNRIPVVLARINEDISLHEFEANVRNLVKATEDAYWELYCGYRLVESSQQALDAAADLWRVASERAKAGGPPEAEAQARGLYNTFLTQLIAAKHGSSVPGNDPNGLYGREQDLREKMGIAATDGRLIRPIDLPYEARVEFEWSDVLCEALIRNVDLRKQKWFIKTIELELASAKNQLLPQLDITGIYRWVGVGDVLANTNRNGFSFPTPNSSALEGLTDGDFQELGARIELTPTPMGARRAMAGIQNRKLALNKSHQELQEKEMALVGLLSKAWRDMDSLYETMRTSRDQLAATADEIQVYRDKITKNAGELPQLLDALLRAEERRATAQRIYYQAICKYNQSIISIHYLKGSLLDLNAIALQEGQWPGKAYWDAEELAKQRAAGHYFDYGYTRPAVVSRGPVESGMPTEGNRTIGGQFPNRLEQGQPAPADRSSSQEKKQPREPRQEFPDLKNLDTGSAPEEVPPPKKLDNSVPRAGVPGSNNRLPRVTSNSHSEATPAYDWGDLNLTPAPVVTASSKSLDNVEENYPNALRSSPQSNSPQWRAKANR